MSFDDLGLGPEVLRAVNDAGYTEPTPIQKDAIPYVLMGRDVFGCAQTGTGKTASFTLPMIDILASGRARARMPRSLIITPTRELATQIADNFEKYGKYHKLNMALLIGGVSFVEQIAKLDRGVDVLIVTPGRLLDHFERGRILLTDIKILVLDEADRMMDMGFMPDVERIVSLLPKIRQTLFFSATLAPEIRRLADRFTMNPKEITISPNVAAAETIIQGMMVVAENEKREALRQLINAEDVTNALIFCNRKRDVDTLYRSLKQHKFSVAALHGDMSQPARLETLETFKNGDVKLLVASDVAARGLDLPKVSHVFNFDVPMHSEDYVHRIGRTGRAGRSGHAYTLATPEDTKVLAAIESLIGNPIPLISIEGIAAAELDQDAGRRGRPRRGGTRPAPSAAREQLKRTKESKPKSRRRRTPKEPTAKPAPEKKPVKAAEKPAQPANRPRQGQKSSNEGNDNGRGQVVGMGQHVPAFMQQPPKSGS